MSIDLECPTSFNARTCRILKFFKASSSTVYCPSSPPPFSNERNAKETRFLIALAGNTLNGVVPEYPYLRRMAKEKACIVPLHN
eukprot:CCRYP_008118-RC/>CCRYP_008118-RC protein AED:0.48 eAED:1.00 QI:0/0/0/1/0/0/2/0/83